MQSFISSLKSFILEYLQGRDILLFLLAGLITLGCIDVVFVQKLQRENAYHQSLMAQKLQSELQASLKEHETALIALDVVYQNLTDVRHFDLQPYGKSITATLKGFQWLFYTDPTLTIRHVYPLTEENRKLVGVSLVKNPALKELFRHSKISGKVTASPLITFLDHQGSLFTIIPIYQHNHGLKGYAVGVISLNAIWEPLKHNDFLKKYYVQLEDNLEQTFFRNIPLKQHGRLTTRLPVYIADQQWTLILQPMMDGNESLTVFRISLWSTGAIIMYLMVMLMSHKKTLREAKQQFETIFDASPDGILMLDDKLGLQLINPAVEAWSELNKAQLAEKTFFELFQCHCPYLNKCREQSFLLCTSEQVLEDLPDTLEVHLVEGNKILPKTFRMNATRIQHLSKGSLKSQFICQLGDITPAKELAKLKETYVATLTHDLKTPLVAQRMVLENFLAGRMGPILPQQHRVLSGSFDSVKELLEMVYTNLIYYKLESAVLTLHTQPISLADMMAEATENLRPLMEKRDLTLDMQIASTLPQVWVDPLQMKRVFNNLIANAISYSERNTTLRIYIQLESPENVLITVENEGQGIGPVELPQIFEKYYSLSRKFKQIGSGLGLYISRSLVEMHGGTIWAESEPNKLTRFFISLPVTQPL